MKYSIYIGDKLNQKNAPVLSNESNRIIFNISNLEGKLKNLEEVKHLFHKDNLPEYNFFKIRYSDQLEKLTKKLPPQLLFYDLLKG